MESAGNVSLSKDRIAKSGILKGYSIQAFLPVTVVALSILLHLFVPNRQFVNANEAYTVILSLFFAGYAAWLIRSAYNPKAHERLQEKAPLIAVTFALLALWELLTQKLDLLLMPYFPSQVKVLEALISEFSPLAESTVYSIRLLILGYAIGTALGLITGIMMGWYRQFSYWLNPFIKVIGPIPATAWIPIVMIVFPSSFSASIFLMVLATWFPVTVMTMNGIANVSKSYFEVAKTLGASEHYLIRKVAIPAAFPHIFLGLFMGTGSSFVTLIVAEMLGVKAGLGFYINWATGWGEYYKVYAALFIMAFLFSGFIAVLFKLKDKILIWQKGLMKW